MKRFYPVQVYPESAEDRARLVALLKEHGFEPYLEPEFDEDMGDE